MGHYQKLMEQVPGVLPNSRKTSLNASEVLNKNPQGNMNFKGAQGAYDEIFNKKTPIKESKQEEKREYTDEEKYRMLGAIQVIKEKLDKGVNTQNVTDIVSFLKGIAQEL